MDGVAWCVRVMRSSAVTYRYSVPQPINFSLFFRNPRESGKKTPQSFFFPSFSIEIEEFYLYLRRVSKEKN